MWEDTINSTGLKHYIHVDTEDDPKYRLYNVFPFTNYYLMKWYSEGHTTLVHCHSGHSRSVTVVAAYLMAGAGVSSDKALGLINLRRYFGGRGFGNNVTCRSADPNDGFLQQLWVYYYQKYQQFNPGLQMTLWPKNATITKLK